MSNTIPYHTAVTKESELHLPAPNNLIATDFNLVEIPALASDVCRRQFTNIHTSTSFRYRTLFSSHHLGSCSTNTTRPSKYPKHPCMYVIKCRRNFRIINIQQHSAYLVSTPFTADTPRNNALGMIYTAAIEHTLSVSLAIALNRKIF